MAQLTVERDGREIGQLRAAVRARGIDPKRMTRLQLLRVLATPVELAKMKSWRGSTLARRRAAEVLRGPLLIHTVKLANLKAGRRQTIANVPIVDEKPAPSDAARDKRLAAIMSVHGMWKGDADKPCDAVEYQREVRAEWP